MPGAAGERAAAGGGMPPGRPLVVATVAMSPALQELVTGVLAAWLPRVDVAALATCAEVVGTRPAWVLVAPAADGAMWLALLRQLREEGYGGRVLLLTRDPDLGGACDVDDLAELARLRACRCALGRGFAQELVAALLEPDDEDGMTGEDDDLAQLREEVAGTRRLLAFAEHAGRVPHALNNPLTALLAEAQLLQLEELGPEQRAATERIVELARRVIGLVREFQAARPEPRA